MIDNVFNSVTFERTNLERVYLFEYVWRVFGRRGGRGRCGGCGGRRGRGPPLADSGGQHVDEAAGVVVALERVGAHEPGRLQHSDAA